MKSQCGPMLGRGSYSFKVAEDIVKMLDTGEVKERLARVVGSIASLMG